MYMYGTLTQLLRLGNPTQVHSDTVTPSYITLEFYLGANITEKMFMHVAEWCL